MILILTKTKTDNKIDCKVTIAAEGIHSVGDLHFPIKLRGRDSLVPSNVVVLECGT